MASSIKTLGVPKEIKTLEGRVSLTPDGVREFERIGIEVFVEKSAGEGASISDAIAHAAAGRLRLRFFARQSSWTEFSPTNFEVMS